MIFLDRKVKTALYSLQDNENERVVIGKVMVTNNIIDTVSLLQQRLKNEGLRERTIYDYVKWYEHNHKSLYEERCSRFK